MPAQLRLRRQRSGEWLAPGETPGPPPEPPTPFPVVNDLGAAQIVYTQANIDSWPDGAQYTRLASSPGGNLNRSLQTIGSTITLAQLSSLRDDAVWAKCQMVLGHVDLNNGRTSLGNQRHAAVAGWLNKFRIVGLSNPNTCWEPSRVAAGGSETQRLNAGWILDNATQAAAGIGYSDPQFDRFLVYGCLRPGVPMVDQLLNWNLNANWHAVFAAVRLAITAYIGDEALWAEARAFYSLRLSQAIYHPTYDLSGVVPLRNENGTVLQTSTQNHWNIGGAQINASFQPIISPFGAGAYAERTEDFGHACLFFGGMVHGAFTILAQGETMTAIDHARLKAGLNHHADRVYPFFQNGTWVTPRPGNDQGGPEHKQSWYPAKRYLDLTAEANASLTAIVNTTQVSTYSASGANHLTAEALAA